MSDIKTYNLETYVPGKSTFGVSLGDIFVVPNNETLKSIEYVSISNNGIIQCKKEGSGINTKFIFTPTSNIKEPNHKYDVTVKFTLTTEINSDENTASVKTRNCFIKLILTPEINDNTSKLNITNYMGKLSPDEYMKEHSLKDDLDSLVTKKALITNLKEFGKQVQNKVSNVQVFAIRYDLEGGNWDNGNEGRTSFVNSISYVAPAPVKTGYTFNGWKLFKINDNKETATALNNDNITTDSMIPVGTNFDVLCVADWTRIAYELKLYDASNAVYFNPKDVDYSKNPKLEDIKIVESNGDGNSKTISLVTPEKVGYTFKYWTTTNKYGQIITCKNDQNINEMYDQIFEASNDTGTRTIELTPYFEAKVYTLNYNLNSDNATLDDSLTDSSKNNEYVYGTTFTLPIPRRNGYKFNGWTIGSLVNQFVINPTDLEDITTSTVEVKASWTAATFHLDFDLQNGSIADNSNYTLKASTAIALSNPTRSGYIFDGWEYNSADGTVTLNNTTKEYTFTPSDTVDHDITLKAIWKESEETEYTLQIWEETSDSTGTFTSAEDDTCVYRLIKSISKTGKTGTNTGFTSSNLTANSGYNIPTGFELSKIENVSIKADGTSVAKIYIHRNTCTITIIDKYDTTSSSSSTVRTYTSLYRTDINSIGKATSNKISGKFGQTLIAYPIFNDTYPELNYTCNTPGKSLVFTTSNQTVTFTYTKKNVRVTFDLNNVGTWKIGKEEFNSDIYSIDIPYGTILDNSHIPSVTNYNAISSSKWVIESKIANDEISDFTKYEFTKDTKIRRIPTFYNNKIIISAENYDEANFGITNVINSAYYTTTNSTNYLSTSIRPIELLTPAFDAYNFIGYKYKFGESSSFSDKYITSINKDIWTATNASNDLYIEACFERKEPTLDLSDIKVTYESEKLTVQNIALKNGATKFYISSTIPNANVSTNLGNESSSAVNGKHSAYISGSFATDNNHNTIVLIPSKEIGAVKITGKPFIGTISKINGTEATVSWIQSYQVYDNQDNATLTNVEFAGNEVALSNKDLTLNISANAEKVAITNGDISIIEKNNNTFTYDIDNFDGKNHTIQITPIIYNKSGKSAFITYKQSIEEIKSDLIELENNKDSYYTINTTDLTAKTRTIGSELTPSIREYSNEITLNNKVSKSQLAFNKPTSSLKNYYIKTITITLPSSTIQSSNSITCWVSSGRTIEFQVDSNLNFSTDTVVKMDKKISIDGVSSTASNVKHSPSINGNYLILTDNENGVIRLDLSNKNQVSSVVCELEQESGTTTDKYFVTKVSETIYDPVSMPISLNNVAYSTSGAKTEITLNYTANSYRYSLTSLTGNLSNYAKIKSAVDLKLNSVINQSSNIQSGYYINSSDTFTMTNIANTNNIIMPNSLNVSLSSANDAKTATYFNTTTKYNYSNVQEIIKTYKSEIVNKIL